MRYNPPPNWPKPPEGWAPHPDWSPDPSWPSPPPGWRLWIDDDGPSAERKKSALGQLKSAGDDSEYFGGEFAWADDHGPAPSDDDLHAASPAPQTQRTEVDPKDLSVQHLGKYARVTWDDEHKYDIGKIVAVSADSGVIRVKLAGIETPIAFQREIAADGLANPVLHVWI